MSSKAVLVVDDDDGVRTLVQTLLRRKKLVTDEASNGQEAIAKLESHAYHAIVLDLMMPRLSGFDVIDYLERTRPEVPCVVISAAAPRDLQRIESKPVVRSVLRKPFDISDLIDAVEQCVSAGS